MVDITQLIEIRWHGRGGQGAVTSADLVARAAINEGKFAQAFSSFGPERRGAPVSASVRIDSKNPIRVRAEIAEPDVVVVLDLGLLHTANITSGLKENGVLIVNTKKSFQAIELEFKVTQELAIVDATKVAREELGINIVNTSMVGALIKATGVVELASLVEPLQHRFGRLAERNVNAMERAYEATLVRG
jgi:pyruvate ferredoxin oxidoreductase gamma subunit